MIRSAAAVLLMMAATSAGAAVPINGRWITGDGSAVITVGPCGAQTCGRITTVLKAEPGAPKVDAGNPDPALRTRPIVGLPILTQFADKGDDWRGRIYDPRNGKTYKSIVKRNPDGTLKVQGCIAFFCQTQIWRPVR
ncbi:conserved exported hypothetical protein [Sphingomonas sp. EC-HK361]|jgi:uncharacterized protein (DUF2147 family)|uniref:DUF2147 domain-containing protein n=1 Tax=Sphingomonas sp. EC-HK361 TaxID=2038397 RepID=UPI0012564A20|nr:DUF2147 domain-containing protein [Sphingomonas sp. EC-HK361]VVT19940.1 conserved exported hypothetical protein [Sphingomonas sp. EC-HK361]